MSFAAFMPAATGATGIWSSSGRSATPLPWSGDFAAAQHGPFLPMWRRIRSVGHTRCATGVGPSFDDLAVLKGTNAVLSFTPDLGRHRRVSGASQTLTLPRMRLRSTLVAPSRYGARDPSILMGCPCHSLPESDGLTVGQKCAQYDSVHPTEPGLTLRLPAQQGWTRVDRNKFI